MEFAEELSNQISKELNETIIIYQVEGSWIKCHDDTNMYCMSFSNQVSHRYFPTNINKNESLLLINGANYKMSLFCYSKCDITTITQMYNETIEYKNNLNKEFNLDCAITTFYNDNNVIDEVIIHISEYDLGKYIQPIYAKTYLECHEQINKIIILKNELLSQYGTIEDPHESEFVLNIDNNEIITLQYTLYCNDDPDDISIRITVATNKLVIHEVYNQFRNYINNFIVPILNEDDEYGHLYDFYITSSMYIDMRYNDNKSNVSVKITSHFYNCHITINSEISDITFIGITETYNEVINYISVCYHKLRYINNKVFQEFNIIFNNNVVNIDAHIINRDKFSDKHICATSYIEFTEKLEVIILDGKQLLEQERLNKLEDDTQKIIMELSAQLKEDIVINEFTNKSFTILGIKVNGEYKIKINVKYMHNTIYADISKIYNEIRTFRNNNDLHKKYQFDLYIETYYTYCRFDKFVLKWDDNEISGQNYFECCTKIAEYINVNQFTLNQKLALKIKEKQEKFATKLKLKYGDKTVLTKTNNYSCSYNSNPSSINLVISNVDIEHIDLLDIIHHYLGNRIVNGFIKQTNCANYEKYMNSSTGKPIFNITIQNCLNLKIINNIIDFENNAYLKIDNCPKLEFIQNYNNFSEIYIDNQRVKVITE